MGSVDAITASLRIFSDDFDPDEVTRLVGKTPTSSWRRGDVRVTRSGREHVARRGMWIVEAERTSPGDLDVQIADILKGTMSDLSVWKHLSDHYKIDLFCGLFLQNGNEGISLSPQSLQSLGERGIELGLDIYAPESQV